MPFFGVFVWNETRHKDFNKCLKFHIWLSWSHFILIWNRAMIGANIHMSRACCVCLFWLNVDSVELQTQTKTGPASSLILVRTEAGPICMSSLVTNATIGLGTASPWLHLALMSHPSHWPCPATAATSERDSSLAMAAAADTRPLTAGIILRGEGGRGRSGQSRLELGKDFFHYLHFCLFWNVHQQNKDPK